MHVVVIHGSPSVPSRSSALAEHLAERLEALGVDCEHVRLEQFSATALFRVDTCAPAIREYLASLEDALEHFLAQLAGPQRSVAHAAWSSRLAL